MAIDLSKLSDSDLEALANNDLSKVSDAGLKYIARQEPVDRPIEERVSRIPGLVARGMAPSMMGAALGAPLGPVGMLAGSLAIPAAELTSQAYNAIVPEDYRLKVTPSQAISNLLTQIGLPQPETTPERMITQGSSALGGTAASIPGFMRLGQVAATPTRRAVSTQMAAAPGSQMVAAPVGAATGEAVESATDSPLAGMFANIVAGGVAGARRGEKPQVPTKESVKDAARAAYEVATSAGVIVQPNSFQKRLTDIETTVKSAGFDADLHPKVAAVLRRFQTEGQTPKTLDELEILRRVASSAAGSLEKDERRLGRMIISKLDDYVENLGQADLIGGNAAAGSTALKTARNLWSRSVKTETLDDIIEKATTSASQYSQSGMENALRTQFRQLANNKNRLSQFNSEEQAAIKYVARGGDIQNVLRYLGKLAPTGVVSGGLSTGAGYLFGGPLGAAVLPTVGAASRFGAEKMMQQNVENLRNQVLMGRQIGRGTPTIYSTPAAMRGLLYSNQEAE